MGGRRRKQVDEEEEEEVELQEESEDDSDDSDDDDDEGVALMEKAEGIDDAVRRKLRRDERALNKAIQDGTVSYEEGRDQNNELFKSVVFTREAVLDGENLNALAKKVVKNSESHLQVPRYDADRLVQKLTQKCASSNTTGSSFFDWGVLGREAGICFNAVPSRVSFLNGPLQADHQVKVRKQAKRGPKQRDEEGEGARPTAVQDEAGRGEDADRLSAVEKNMRQLGGVLKKRVVADHKKRKAEYMEVAGVESSNDIPKEIRKKLNNKGNNINGVQFLFNPKSFTQTVENIFYFSFLVRNGQAMIGVQDKIHDLPFSTEAGLVVSERTSEHKRKEPTQCVASLTMADWRRMCEAYGVTEKGDVPHREGSKQHKRQRTGAVSASQQSHDE